MEHVMLASETLDTAESAVILALAAVRFGPLGLGPSFYIEIDIDDQLKRGRTVSGRSLQWWMEQPDERRQIFSACEHAPDLFRALARFNQWIPSEVLVWGNGVNFENVILRSAYRTAGLAPPWKYWQDRCFRTLQSQDGVRPLRDQFNGLLEEAHRRAEFARELLWPSIQS